MLDLRNFPTNKYRGKDAMGEIEYLNIKGYSLVYELLGLVTILLLRGIQWGFNWFGSGFLLLHR